MEADLKGACLLLLDDDVSTTCLMSNFLHRIGYGNCHTLNKPSAIFDEVERLQPDLLLLDLCMPELDGFQIIEQLRRQEFLDESVPIMVITGKATAKNKRRALSAGASDLLVKPFDPSEVMMRIRSLLQTRFLRLEIQEHNRLLEQRVLDRTGQLERALAELKTAQDRTLQQERLSAFGEMAGGVVHDFSNALMSIIGYSEMLLTNESARAEESTVLDYLRIINTAGRDGAHIVSRLRDFYRPRDGVACYEILDLNAIARQSIELSRPRVDSKNGARKIVFALDLGEEVTASGIAAELREALTNLITNAVDAIPADGQVLVRTVRENGESIIEVTDTGAGMTPEIKDHCLEPFFTTKGDAGTGLGLAMVFGIVRRHLGQVEIDSAPGAGSTFRIRLPHKSVPASSEASAPAAHFPLAAPAERAIVCA